jgi:hypothetical protein
MTSLIQPLSLLTSWEQFPTAQGSSSQLTEELLTLNHPVPVRQKVAAVSNNTAQVTLYKETVTAPVIATVQVSVLNAQGQPVTGSVDVTIVPVPGPIELKLEVAQSTLVVSDTNSPVPAQRQPLDPTKPNSTAVTVSVIEQGTNAPVPNTSVTLSSTDSNSLWVVGTTARLGQIVAQTDENGRVQATFYASRKAGEVTITATIDLGGGNTLTKQATITQEPGPPVLTVTTDKPEIFVRLPDNFNDVNYSQLPRSAEVTAKVADANGNPHKDIVVNFAASEGIITAAATTDANGEAKVNYSPPDLVPANGQVTITGANYFQWQSNHRSNDFESASRTSSPNKHSSQSARTSARWSFNFCCHCNGQRR